MITSGDRAQAFCSQNFNGGYVNRPDLHGKAAFFHCPLNNAMSIKKNFSKKPVLSCILLKINRRKAFPLCLFQPA
jgi:hypothetical protein